MFSFFFSSRRRHTRWPRDWSSDVCSSDLKEEDTPSDKEEQEGCTPCQIGTHLKYIFNTFQTLDRLDSGSRYAILPPQMFFTPRRSTSEREEESDTAENELNADGQGDKPHHTRHDIHADGPHVAHDHR